MHELPGKNTQTWLKGLAAAGWTFSVIMGTAGLGLMAGLAYGACVASQTPRTSPTDDIFIFIIFIAWVVCLLLYGVIGFVIGLAAGLLVMLMTWIVRLAKRIASGLER